MTVIVLPDASIISPISLSYKEKVLTLKSDLYNIRIVKASETGNELCYINKYFKKQAIRTIRTI